MLIGRKLTFCNKVADPAIGIVQFSFFAHSERRMSLQLKLAISQFITNSCRLSTNVVELLSLSSQAVGHLDHLRITIVIDPYEFILVRDYIFLSFIGTAHHEGDLEVGSLKSLREGEDVTIIRLDSPTSIDTGGTLLFAFHLAIKV